MKLEVSGATTAHTFPVGLPGGHVVHFVVAKRTWRVDRGALVPHEAPLDVFIKDTEVDGRLHTGDQLLAKARCDVVVLGDAVTGRAVQAAEVSVRVPGMAKTLHVTGDRTWQRGFLGRVRASEPGWFERMPLTWARAYGGKGIADDEGTELPFPANPDGRGFIVPGQKQRVDGAPLPNLEWPDQKVSTWDQQPEPAGFAFYPRTWALRLIGAVTPGRKGSTPTIERKAFQQAHPALEVPGFPRGRAEVLGASASPFAVELEDPGVQVDLMRPKGAVSLPLTWDLLVLEPEASRVVAVGRTAFRYDPDQDWAAHVQVRGPGGAR